jgi:hypothetical protein
MINFPLFCLGEKFGPLTLREEHGVFQRKFLETTGSWRKSICSSPGIICVIKSRKWGFRSMQEIKNMCKISVRNPEGMRSLEHSRQR